MHLYFVECSPVSQKHVHFVKGWRRNITGLWALVMCMLRDIMFTSVKPHFSQSCIDRKLRSWAQYSTVLYCTVLYCTVVQCTVQYFTVLYCPLLYFTALYVIALHTWQVADMSKTLGAAGENCEARNRCDQSEIVQTLNG